MDELNFFYHFISVAIYICKSFQGMRTKCKESPLKMSVN